MKKVIFGIFAHPDDEAFGPAATLLSEVRDGNTVHLVLLTAGEAGTNPDNVPDLASTRLEEWKTSGALLGASRMEFLDYKDGQLNNQTMIEVASRIESLVTEALGAIDADASVELMSFDTGGLTGHIDHIVASRATCLAFYRLKERDQRVNRLRLFCFDESLAPTANTDWLYMDAGHSADLIDETVDARQYRDELTAIAKTHHSQRNDGEAYLAKLDDQLGINHFVVKT